VHYSWRLVLAPDFVLDYVVAHEVAHLVYMSHGPRFRATVDRLTPHRAAAEAWLRVHGSGLLLVGASFG
jgi:predicted metal-dependent hydrolase